MAKGTAESNAHERDSDLTLLCSKREYWLVTCEQHGGIESETQDHVWRCQVQQYVVIRERFMTKKDEEELRK